MIWFGIALKLVGNGLDFVWKFVRNYSNTNLNKSSLNNWIVLKNTDSSPKRTDRCQLLPPWLLVCTSQILSLCPANTPT